jgi:hypothetical protein
MRKPQSGFLTGSVLIILALSRIHAEENHRWTPMNTDSEDRTLALRPFALGHYPVNGF